MRLRRATRDLILWAVLTGGLVAFVLGAPIIGAALVVFALWQYALIARGRGGLLVDQRWADREGKPRIRSK